MTSTLNPYVVDRAVHTEGLFGFKSNKIQPEALPGAPKVETYYSRGLFSRSKKQTPSELFAKYAADTNNYSGVHGQATTNSLGVYTCYYLFKNKLLKCISRVKPGWRSTESGTMTCTSPDSDNSVLVPYPSDKVLWSIS